MGSSPRMTTERYAFVRLETEQGLYREDGTAVTFLTPTVFRAAIPRFILSASESTSLPS